MRRWSCRLGSCGAKAIHWMLMLNIFLKITNLLVLLGATAWLAQERSWEPLILFIGSLSGAIVQEVRDQKQLLLLKQDTGHDRDVFLRLDQILSEQDLKDEFNHHVGNGSVHRSFSENVSNFLYAADNIGNNFLNPEVNAKFQKFINSLGSLRDLIAHSFFPLENKPGEMNIYFLYPELKKDGSAAKRDLYRATLRKINAEIDQTLDDYKLFRLSVKGNLQI